MFINLIKETIEYFLQRKLNFFVFQLITPEDVINPKRDELSMMTYLSQYPNAKVKEGAPLRPRLDPSK